jgi:hypothetical protein
MIFRLYHETRGGHVHCRLFAGLHESALGKCGDLVFRSEEFATFVKRFAFIDLRREGDGPIVQQIMGHVGNGNNQTEYTGR